MKNARVTTALAVIATVCMIPVAGQALTAYTQHFEDLAQTQSDALELDGWLIYGNVFNSSGDYLYGYGAFPAPNHDAAFSQIVIEQGGEPQGAQQLVIFSDYENGDHGVGNLIESNVFQEQPITATDLETYWSFEFDAKLGNIEGASTAAAFIKTIDPSNNYWMTNYIPIDMTNISQTWQRYVITIGIVPELDGQLLQFGFTNTATDYAGSGIFYDNIEFYQDTIDVPAGPAAARAELRQNYPNPFNPSTRIDYTMDEPGFAELSIFDLAGRRIATLHSGDLAGGDHHAIWNGRTDAGNSAPTGHYRYVLRTSTGRISRSMVLLK